MSKEKKKFVKLIPGCTPEDALDLPTGRIQAGFVASAPTPELTMEAVELILKKGGHDKNFYSQAGIIEFASEKYGKGEVKVF